MDRPVVRYARSGTTELAYGTLGEGPPDVVVVPGFVSHLDLNWELPGLQHLAEVRDIARLVVFDKRGTGLSRRDGGFGSMAERMDDIRVVMDAAGCERATLFGISEGGPSPSSSPPPTPNG